MEKKIGFIGCGNMSKAIIAGLVNGGRFEAKNILVFDRKAATNRDMQQKFGITPGNSAAQVAANADILIGAVKPNVMLSVISDLTSSMKPDALFISIAAGVTIATLASVLGDERKIVRAMPNTPALVGEGMTSLTPNTHVSSEEMRQVQEIFTSFGKAAVVPEYQIHAVVGASGSAPAYVFMLIEAMADAAVLGGLPRAQAYQFAAQAVKGAAEMVLESGKHPAELKDMVCSPGGTTIEAVRTLEEKGLRSAVIEAMQRCMAKSEAMSRN
ncbi:pyrroline-5-carboxylate reductase [Izhakiella australiensis]|uniref:Pyrroline-5-carboxylate reductase n=1 Tax=Izhakiella australiensis TaxID=1926881 RepID=A0A1S8YKZ7_9GAMM|nr:pyrroline-5-carboxylate reductase [Izhakiella australiensis]OON39568.1 pyrroline-5-carboxylate reductase [Izhakiella australiensis]